MLSINGRIIPAIEPDLYNDEIPFSADSLCRWADRRFAKANREPDYRIWQRSKHGIWLLADAK